MDGKERFFMKLVWVVAILAGVLLLVAIGAGVAEELPRDGGEVERGMQWILNLLSFALYVVGAVGLLGALVVAGKDERSLAAASTWGTCILAGAAMTGHWGGLIGLTLILGLGLFIQHWKTVERAEDTDESTAA